MLPKLPYKGRKTERQIISFQGLNRSESTQDGELRDAEGLSTADFPCLTQRKGRTKLTGYSDAKDLFEWDGKLLVVANSTLYLDGEPLTNVLDGKKQWAVVNSKLCIWPDKISLDLLDKKISHFEASMTTEPGVEEETVTLTDSSLTALLKPVVRRNISAWRFKGNADRWNPAVYTYGTDRAAVEACWNAATGQWSGLAALENLRGIMSSRNTNGMLSAGEIFIPEKQSEDVMNDLAFAFVEENAQAGKYPDKSKYNSEGYYGVFTKTDPAYWDIIGSSDVLWWFDIYKVGMANPLFSAVFQVGDAVSVTGTPFGACDVEHRIIQGITNQTNTLNFAAGTFREPAAYHERESVLPGNNGEKYYILLGETYYCLTMRENVAAGQVLLVFPGDSPEVQVWDPEKKKAVSSYTIGNGLKLNEGTSERGTKLTATKYEIKDTVTIQRSMPELDYICERGNRLWGVSNRDRTIYASALGLPGHFYDYAGLSTDSYALAVGSEGDFTGICAFGGGVCCWKERRLHKVLGSFPAEYYTAEYEITGVQAGSERSMVIINETLYYKGPDGVYAYAGGTPGLISYKLGSERLRDGIGERDGTNYCLNVTGAEKKPMQLVYDTVHRQWMKEDSIRVEAMAESDGTLYLLDGAGEIWKTDEKSEETIHWMAEFVPMDETGHDRKRYSKLMLRLDMHSGAWLQVELQKDRGPWEIIWTQAATRAMTVNVPLQLMRCDRVGIRLRGKGRTTIRSMVREYSLGSSEE